jgi:hypothetical protein
MNPDPFGHEFGADDWIKESEQRESQTAEVEVYDPTELLPAVDASLEDTERVNAGRR